MMVLHFPPAHRGGAELQCWKQARSLAHRGHEVTILTQWLWAGSARREIKDGVVIRRLGSFLPLTMAVRRLHCWLRLKKEPPTAAGPDPFSADGPGPGSGRALKKFRWMAPVEWMGSFSFILEVGLWLKFGGAQADVVHVHESHWLAGFGHWVGERFKAPVFCKEACGEVLQWQGEGDVPWRMRWKYRRDRCRFIAITPLVRSKLEQAGIPAERIVEIPNGVEMPDVMAQAECEDSAIYAGNFTQGAVYKAFDILLQAWGKAIQKEPKMKLRLFGSGGTERWKQVAEQEGCGTSVEFAGPTDDLQSQFLKAGFLVLPSRVEGLSNVLLEAQAIGLPAVVSDIGGNTAVVRDGENGCVVPVENSDALAAAMLHLYRSSALRASMGRSARLLIGESFAIEKVAAQLEEAYRQAIHKKSGGAVGIGSGEQMDSGVIL